MARKSRLNDDTYLAPPATRIRERMEKQQLTNAGLAEKVGVSSAAISQFVNGQTNPTLETLVKIAKAFDTTTDYLLGRTDDPNVQRSVIDDTGLSDEAVRKLKIIKNAQKNESVELGLLNRIICNRNLFSALSYTDDYLSVLQALKIQSHFYSTIVPTAEKLDLYAGITEEECERFGDETEEYDRVMDVFVESGIFGANISRALKKVTNTKGLSAEKMEAICATEAFLAWGKILKELIDSKLSSVEEMIKDVEK